jgi:hypothetical protein
VNENSGGVMRDKERMYEATWSTDTFSLGRYTAEVSMAYGEGDSKTLSRSLTFWVVPVQEVGAVLGSLILLVLLVVFGLRSYVRRELKKAGHVRGNTVPSNVTFAKRLGRTLAYLAVLVAVVVIGFIILSS